MYCCVVNWLDSVKFLLKIEINEVSQTLSWNITIFKYFFCSILPIIKSGVRVMVPNATFNNISAIWWCSVL